MDWSGCGFRTRRGGAHRISTRLQRQAARWRNRWRRALTAAGTVQDGKPDTHKFRTNVEYAGGGHGAALAAFYWDDIARFVLDGVPPKEEGPETRPDGIVRVLGFLSPLIWFVIAVVVIGIGWAILAPLGLPFPNALIQLGSPLELSGLIRDKGTLGLFQLVPWNWAGATPGWFLALLFALYLKLLAIIATKA